MLRTVAAAIAGGVAVMVVARRLGISSIVLLLLAGMFSGPEFLGIVNSQSLGTGLRTIVALAVGLILFEGGLTLDAAGYKGASGVIRKLLTIGLLVTWLTTSIIIWLIFHFHFAFCLLAASLVIVTGPTVIAPLLKRIKVRSNLHNILHWEGVLIDPLGVFVVLLCYEWIVGQSGGTALGMFFIRLLIGLITGVVGGYLIYFSFRWKLIPEDMLNIGALALAVLTFGVSEAMTPESGLLAVTVAGFLVGLKQPAEIRQIKAFKAEITDLMIGVLFILLASRLRFDEFREFGVRGAILVACVMFVVRPLNVLVATWGEALGLRERLFLSWVAPRGIVAASMASFVTLRLNDANFVDFGDPKFLETFTYSVIMATVLIQGFSSGLVARVLGLKRPAPTGWLIVGAHPLGRKIASFIANEGKLDVVLVDTNAKAIREAVAAGLKGVMIDARERGPEEREEFQRVGNLLALTDNEDLNVLVCQRWKSELGRDHLFRWSHSEEGKLEGAAATGNVVWSNLPKPSLLSAELVRGEATLFTREQSNQSDGLLTTSLLGLRDGEIVFSPGTGAETDKMPVLCLRREAEYLARSLKPEHVVTLEASDISSLFGSMLDILVKSVPEIPREEVLRELIERESSFPTTLGHGIAVPHAFIRNSDKRICMVARVAAGLDFQAPDGKPVRLVFLILSPTGDPEGHLATLADVARLVGDPATRERLLSAEDSAQLLLAITTFNPTPPMPAS